LVHRITPSCRARTETAADFFLIESLRFLLGHTNEDDSVPHLPLPSEIIGDVILQFPSLMCPSNSSRMVAILDNARSLGRLLVGLKSMRRNKPLLLSVDSELGPLIPNSPVNGPP
jgi:hypothetical protein